MKKISLLIVFTAFFVNAFSQELEVTTESKKLQNDFRDAIKVSIPKVEKKTVEKEWKRLMKDYDAEDVDRGKEIIADNVLIESITDNTIDIYAKAEEKDNKVNFFVAVDLGGDYLAEEDASFATMKNIVKNFAARLASEAYEEIIDDQLDVVDDINDEIEDINDDKEHLEKKNEKYREKIKENNYEIEELTEELDKQDEKLEKEQEILEQLKKEAANLK